jgi:hypothetical protein
VTSRTLASTGKRRLNVDRHGRYYTATRVARPGGGREWSPAGPLARSTRRPTEAQLALARAWVGGA